jgi:hypothetical protein
MQVLELLEQDFFEIKHGSILQNQTNRIRLQLVSKPIWSDIIVDPPYNSLENFVKTYPTVESPEVGSFYMVSSIIVLSRVNLIDWYEILATAELVDIEEQKLIFRLNDKIMQFPRRGKFSNNQLQKTMVFSNQTELDKFLTVIHTTYENWKIVKKIIGFN